MYGTYMCAVWKSAPVLSMLQPWYKEIPSISVIITSYLICRTERGLPHLPLSFYVCPIIKICPSAMLVFEDYSSIAFLLCLLPSFLQHKRH